MGGWSERVMGQKGFFDVERRLEAISAKGDPLETIKKMVRWEDFRADIEAVTERRPEERQNDRTGAISRCGDEMMRMMLYEGAPKHAGAYGEVVLAQGLGERHPVAVQRTHGDTS